MCFSLLRGIEYSIAVFTAGSTKLLGESGHRPSRGTVDRILKGEKAADLPVQAPTWSSQLSVHCYMSSNFAPRPKSPGGQYSPPAAAELDASPRLFAVPLWLPSAYNIHSYLKPREVRHAHCSWRAPFGAFDHPVARRATRIWFEGRSGGDGQTRPRDVQERRRRCHLQGGLGPLHQGVPRS